MPRDYKLRHPVLDLKNIRKKAGFTLEKLGEKLDYSYVTLSRMERGKDSINLDVAQVWAESCGYEISLVGPEHGETKRAIDALGVEDVKLVGRLAKILPQLEPSQRATISAILDVWEATPPRTTQGP
jgi:transcriptional regulator with XRE-family HTH domain